MRVKISISKIVLFIILLIYAASLLVPLVWGFFTSLKTNADFRSNVFGLPKGWPWEWSWSNYGYAFSEFFVPINNNTAKVGMLQMFFNSILYAGGGAFFATLAPCVMSYLVVKFPYKFSKVIYAVVIATLILPIVGSLPSEIQMSKNLGLFDSFIGLWIMRGNFLGMYFLVFYATFKTVAKDFSEAAFVDGASNWRVFVSIMLPLVRNAFFTIMLLKFIELWNDYQIPMIYLPSKPTLAYGMYFFNSGLDTSMSWPPMKIAGCMIMLIPILVIFLAFHNKLIGNISMGGVKE